MRKLPVICTKGHNHKVQMIQDQHYVPERFLKQFTTSEGCFYGIKKNNRGQQRIKVKKMYPAQVCYIKNFYDIIQPVLIDRLGIDDPKFLETKGFPYERSLVDTLDVFKRRERTILTREYDLILKSYLSLKQRNLYYRTLLNDTEFKGKILDQIIENREGRKEWLSRLNNIVNLNSTFIDSILSDQRAKLLTDPNDGKNTHLTILFSSATGQNELFQQTATEFLQLDFTVIVAGGSDFFMVSDNPGYTLKRWQESFGIYNTDFKDFHQIFFPINSKQAILIRNNTRNPLNLINYFRQIQYADVSSDEVFELNRGSIFCANERLFCENEDYLKRFIDRVEKDILIQA